MFQIKHSAKLTGLKPETILGIAVLERIFGTYGYDLVITEVTGGTHMENSLHYNGLAADIRSKHITEPSDKQKILTRGKQLLGPSFDFILESVGSENEHYHLEYQPKT